MPRCKGGKIKKIYALMGEWGLKQCAAALMIECTSKEIIGRGGKCVLQGRRWHLDGLSYSTLTPFKVSDKKKKH